jgi:hypothetical protein
MFELYYGYELTEEDLRESCEFDDDDIIISNQTQIDFILVGTCPFLESPILRNLNNYQYTYVNGSFRGVPKSIFIFWH